MADPNDDESLEDLNDLEGAWDLGLHDLFSTPEPEPRSEPKAGDHCGRYQLIEEIAHGGMGRVFRASDDRLDREVAVKILREGLRQDDVMTSRFVEEARIAAQLQHPGIIPVYDVGLDAEGRPWFSMKLVAGRTLSDLLAERRDPRDELARFLGIFRAVCQAVGFAHRNGVIHRDLKPANVMIGSFGEVQVLDWGFAKILQALKSQERRERSEREARDDGGHRETQDSSRSVSGSVLGTPRYMSPEQARGEIEKLDERTDVFALGAMLLEILCDRTPWGRSPDESPIKRAAAGDHHRSLAELEGCGADQTLIDLCKRALSVRAEDRPADAGALAEAIDGYLAEAEERTRQARLEADTALASARHERRARLLTISSGLLILVILAGTGFFFWQHDRARRDELSRMREGLRGAIQDAHLQIRSAEWALADQSLQRGRLLIGEDPPEPLVRELEEQERKLEDARTAWQAEKTENERRERFSSGLAAIRQTAADEPGAGGDEYALCFRDFGCDVETLSPEIAYLELIDLPLDLREDIRLALDDWALRARALEARDDAPRTRAVGSRSRALLELAQLIDHDDWRRRLRAAVLENEGAELRSIAEEAAAGVLDPKDAQLLATTLHRDGDGDLALRVLLASWNRHPDDTWLNHHIARMAHRNRGESGSPGDDELALRHAYMALATSAESPFLREHILEILFDVGRDEEALALVVDWQDVMSVERISRLSTRLGSRASRTLLERMITVHPASASLRLRLATELLRVADFAGAETVLRQAMTDLEHDDDIVGLLAETLLERGQIESALEILDQRGPSESLRYIRQKLLRWRQMVSRRQPIEVPLLRERARLLELSGDADAALALWLQILKDHQGPGAPGQGAGPPGGARRPLPRGLRPKREGRQERNPQQDALAAVMAAVLEDPERNRDLAEAALRVLQDLADLSEGGRGPRMSEVETISADERLLRIFEELKNGPAAVELKALEAAWTELRSRFQPRDRE